MAQRAKLVVLAAVAIIVLVNTAVDGVAIYHLITGDLENYRAWVAISLGLTALINLVVLFLMWLIFEALGRVERESDRLQVFMDSTYRRLPPGSSLASSPDRRPPLP